MTTLKGNELNQVAEVEYDAPVCESCLEVAFDEGVSDLLTQVLLMTEMGADVPDHLCDKSKEPDLNITCTCACNRTRVSQADKYKKSYERLASVAGQLAAKRERT